MFPPTEDFTTSRTLPSCPYVEPQLHKSVSFTYIRFSPTATRAHLVKVRLYGSVPIFLFPSPRSPSEFEPQVHNVPSVRMPAVLHDPKLTSAQFV